MDRNDFSILFDLILYVQVNNLSVMSGRLPGLNQQGLMCPAHDAGEATPLSRDKHSTTEPPF